MLAKKSLGQNFLTNTGIVLSIVDAAYLKEGDSVLEIGPGKGILTEELLKRGVFVTAVEKDTDLIPYLEGKFSKELSTKQLILIHADILEFEPSFTEKYSVVANIPYYITGLIIRKFLTHKNQPEKMVLLVQKEVAERIIASDKKESLLSLSVKAYGTPTYIKTVKAGSFTPAPKVDSAILLIDHVSRSSFEGISEDRFFEILHAGFAHKRKQLFGNLRAVFNDDILREKMKSSGLSEKVRAEDLTLSDWHNLAS